MWLRKLKESCEKKEYEVGMRGGDENPSRRIIAELAINGLFLQELKTSARTDEMSRHPVMLQAESHKLGYG